MPHDNKPKIGISACLLGQPVRYNGDHSHNDLIISELADYVEWVPICPECEIGLGVPRPPIQLVKYPDGIRAQGVKNLSMDVTDALLALPGELAGLISNCRGFILKSHSPSCGVGSVKVFELGGQSYDRIGRGLFSVALSKRYPDIPIVEEIDLEDAHACQQFLVRCQSA